MSRGSAAVAAVALAWCVAAAAPQAVEPVHYRLTFPSPQHHWMQVEVSLTGLPSGPLELRMSRSSPGRYALHDFAKNVYDVEAFDVGGQPLEIARPDLSGWTVKGHGAALTVRYRVFGDEVDGTYLGIDTTHAHLNMPAALMWARGLEDRPVTLTLTPPAGAHWMVATQLFPSSSPYEFTAPNLQYLMDSPVEFGPLEMRQFAAGGQTIRVAVHHTGSPADVDTFVEDVRAVVREHGEVFGGYPAFEPGHYTFLADLLPYAESDAMEHRNSTVLTAPRTIATDRARLLESASHEFFHSWNIERIRPRALEPFDFERANASGELWLGEGFSEYYGSLALSRAGLVDLGATVRDLLDVVTSVALNPARLVRSAEDMSLMAPFVDGGAPRDRTNWGNTYISYYQFGAAIALALDLTLRERSAGRTSLDDYMRVMWRVHGAPGGSRPGYVDRPYSMDDAEARLAEVAGDPTFARDFFARYVQGHEVAGYERLLLQAGLALRPVRPGRAWIGDIQFGRADAGVRLLSPPRFQTPAYVAGLDVGDELRQMDERSIRSSADLAAVLSRRRPGDTIQVSFVDRSGQSRTTTMTLAQDPALELVPLEREGTPLTDEQQRFRARWLH